MAGSVAGMDQDGLKTPLLVGPGGAGRALAKERVYNVSLCDPTPAMAERGDEGQENRRIRHSRGTIAQVGPTGAQAAPARRACRLARGTLRGTDWHVSWRVGQNSLSGPHAQDGIVLVADCLETRTSEVWQVSSAGYTIVIRLPKRIVEESAARFYLPSNTNNDFGCWFIKIHIRAVVRRLSFRLGPSVS